MQNATIRPLFYYLRHYKPSSPGKHTMNPHEKIVCMCIYVYEWKGAHRTEVIVMAAIATGRGETVTKILAGAFENLTFQS